MKIQPIDSLKFEEPVKPPVMKSRLKRLFERQFVRNNNSSEKLLLEEPHLNGAEFEPSSVCLGKMVQNFIEGGNEKQSAVRCGRNCFNRSFSDSSEDELDGCSGGLAEFNIENLKSLVLCASVHERNLLADTARIVDKNNKKICKKIVTDGLLALGYDASICISRWDKSPSCAAGVYEYIDVVISGERILVDIDFRSAFEIARSTKAYKSILQIVPSIFVGKVDRLMKIVAVVSEATMQSLKKKGMPIPPWRKTEYVNAKWVSPHTRTGPVRDSKCGEEHGVGLSVGKRDSVEDIEVGESVFALSTEGCGEEEKIDTAVKEWQPALEIKPKSLKIGVKMVTGLASVFADG